MSVMLYNQQAHQLENEEESAVLRARECLGLGRGSCFAPLG